MLKFDIREEKQEDEKAITDLIQTAFATAEHSDGTEQDLVIALRKDPAFIPELSLVAVVQGLLVGHILFSKAHVGKTTVLILAPLSVLPDFQRQGIGSALIKAGHKKAQELGYSYAFVLGSDQYYPRFGYRPARQFGVNVPAGFPEKNFMGLCWKEDATLLEGDIRFSPVFGIND